MPFRNPAQSNPKARVQSFTVNAHLAGTAPVTAGNYGRFWTTPAKCVVDSIEILFSANSSSGTVTVHKVPSGTAQDSGTALLASTVSTSTGADTRQQGTLSTTAATLELAAGDSLQLVDSGTLTSSADLAVTVGLHWIS